LASQTGSEVRFADGESEVRQLLESYKPDIVLFDLSNTENDPIIFGQIVRKSHADAKLFGTYPHVRKDLKSRADDAGFDYVVPNSAFITTLRQILLEEGKQAE
jgi:DNA-binding NarL/FixJ family response regulator